MPLYDYRCEDGHTTELLRSRDTDMERCAQCRLPALRVPFNRVVVQVTDVYNLGGTHLSVPRSGMDVASPETRQKFSLFQEATQEMDYAYAKAEADLGHPIQGPDLWSQAKQGAREVVAAGEAPTPAKKG